jgi:hypothetical protein
MVDELNSVKLGPTGSRYTLRMVLRKAINWLIKFRHWLSCTTSPLKAKYDVGDLSNPVSPLSSTYIRYMGTANRPKQRGYMMLFR